MLLIFDLDGTLFQTKPVVLLAVRELFAQLGLHAPEENTIFKNAGRGAVQMLLGILPESVDANAIMPSYYSKIRAAIISCGALFPGAIDTVSELYNDNHELVICSNSPIEYIELVLESTGIAKFFKRCYSTQGYATKADAVREIIVTETSAVMIGDTHGDIAAGHENGLLAIAAAYGYGNKEMLKSADYFAYKPEQIVDCVKSLLAKYL